MTTTTPSTQSSDEVLPAAGVPAPRNEIDPPPVPPQRALASLGHGGLVVRDGALAEVPDGAGRADVTAMSEVVGVPDADDRGTPFGYLLPDLADDYPNAHLPAGDPGEVVASLKALGSAMIEDDGDGPATDSTIPPVYTYWGQFIDHDLTANTDRDNDLGIVDRDLVPERPQDVVLSLRNLREPELNLDSVYGDGPGAAGDLAVPYDGYRLRLGDLSPVGPNVPVPPAAGSGLAEDPFRDLPRTADGTARIGDGRNDENLIVAQLHVAFLRFHNAVLDLLVEDGADPGAPQTFAEARRLVCWHHQWLVRHDLLVRLVPQEAIDAVEAGPRFRPAPGRVYMPLEFSVAAFRFGHSMVRALYDHNRNFGRSEDPVAERASFQQMFQFTGKARPPFAGFGTRLPHNWPIEWDRFVGGPTAEFPDRAARRIDTHLALPLDGLTNEGTDPNTPARIRSILKRLAVRNLLRGYKLAIPTGQAVARDYGLPALTPAQIAPEGNRVLRHALEDGGFLTATPLWFYVLREAEIGGGDRLGPVGGRIVADTIIGQLRNDPASYLAMSPDWDPAQLGNPAGHGTIADIGGPDVRTISDLLRLARVL
ncbi:peroxidase family protein [Pseudonocardia parietis]|uniref:Heme peroxidase n=1 Tax=Pseudonocardia parietis TaxID=570936 RepID=A0ABS4VMX7_9PSEU|nr:heme peroxidase family protein [Pseudonocardia parietis]MBP2365287.1 hypothetical protein [Pseudonocardia parietis]